MNPQILEALEPRYPLEQSEEWRLFLQRLEFSSGFAFLVVLPPDDYGVEIARRRLGAWMAKRGERLLTLRMQISNLPEALAQRLLAPLPEGVNAIWAQLEGGGDKPDPRAYHAAFWPPVLRTVNLQRNDIQQRLRCPFILSGPPVLQELLRTEAPDLWGVRDGVVYLDSVYSADDGIDAGLRNLSVSPSGGDPDFTFAEALKLDPSGHRAAERQDLLLLAARQFLERHRWDESLGTAKRVLAEIEGAGNAPDKRRAALDRLGRAYLAKENAVAAEKCFREALALSQDIYGPDHPTVARSLGHLANALSETGREKEAEPLYRRALAIDEKVYGTDHPEVASDLDNLANVLAKTGRYSEAEDLYRRALAIDRKVHGPGHSEVARHLNNLANVLAGMGRVAEAEDCYRRALEIEQQLHGTEHPDVARALNSLGTLLHKTRRFDDAEKLYRQALVIDEKIHGSDHLQVARDLFNIGLLLRVTGRIAEAGAQLARAVETLRRWERQNGREHPWSRSFVHNHQAVLKAMNAPKAEIGSASP